MRLLMPLMPRGRDAATTFPNICVVVRFKQADDTVTPEVSRAAFKLRWLSSRRTVTLKSGQPDSDGPSIIG
jgi:hypothetical protein